MASRDDDRYDNGGHQEDGNGAATADSSTGQRPILACVTYEVVSPITAQRQTEAAAAPPLPGLDGKRIGFVWDMLFDGDLVFTAIADELASRFQGMEFVGYETFGDIHGADEVLVLEELPDRLRAHRIDAVVAGVGA